MTDTASPAAAPDAPRHAATTKPTTKTGKRQTKRHKSDQGPSGLATHDDLLTAVNHAFDNRSGTTQVTAVRAAA